MTKIFHTIGGIEYTLGNFLTFSESYSETNKTYTNEAGETILYPVRSGKKKLSIVIEANSVYLDVLKKLFCQPVIRLKYTHGSDSETNSIGDIKPLIHEAEFIKTSDISIKQISDVRTALPNYGVRNGLGFYDRFGRGAYEFSVTLEEV